jgi:hypothetical protein
MLATTTFFKKKFLCWLQMKQLQILYNLVICLITKRLLHEKE